MKGFKKSRYNIIFTCDNEPYLFNTFTGSFQPLSADLYRIYNAWNEVGTGKSDEEDSVNHLVSIGALIAEDLDELKFLQEISYQDNSIATVTRLSFWLMTTERCNFRCFYCFEDREKCGDVSYTGDDFIAFLDKFPALNQIHITWFGGEPLLNLSLIEELSARVQNYSRQKGIFYDAHIITNGSLLTREIAKRLKELHVTWAQVTLDGPPDVYEKYKSGRGMFNTVIDNLYYLAENMPVTMLINLDQNNIGTMPELFKIMAARGYKNLKIRFSPITQEVQDGESFSPWAASCLSCEEFAAAEKDLIEALYSQGYEEYEMPAGARISYCGGGSSSFYVVGVTGELYRCSHFHSGRPAAAGSIKDGLAPESFTHPWRNEYRTLPDACYECKLLPECQGGCYYSRDHKCSVVENCVSFRFNLIDRLTSILTESKAHNRKIFVQRSAQEQINKLTQVSRGKMLNRGDLKAAALAGGGLGMLLTRHL